jgi:hypothetical protein
LSLWVFFSFRFGGVVSRYFLEEFEQMFPSQPIINPDFELPHYEKEEGIIKRVPQETFQVIKITL